MDGVGRKRSQDPRVVEIPRVSPSAITRALNYSALWADQQSPKFLFGAVYKPDLIQSFIPDKEVILFESVAEFNEKAKYYLAHPDELKQIGALSDHGYENRVREILALLDMN